MLELSVNYSKGPAIFLGGPLLRQHKLGFSLQHGERSAQLMRRIRHELPELLQGADHVREELIESCSETPEFVLRSHCELRSLKGGVARIGNQLCEFGGLFRQV